MSSAAIADPGELPRAYAPNSSPCHMMQTPGPAIAEHAVPDPVDVCHAGHRCVGCKSQAVSVLELLTRFVATMSAPADAATPVMTCAITTAAVVPYAVHTTPVRLAITIPPTSSFSV